MWFFLLRLCFFPRACLQFLSGFMPRDSEDDSDSEDADADGHEEQQPSQLIRSVSGTRSVSGIL